MRTFNNKVLRIGILLVFTYSCKKFVEVNPPVTQLTEGSVYHTDITAIAVITGIYSNLSNGFLSGNRGISVICGLAADELSLFNGVTSPLHIAHYENALFSNSIQSLGGEHWTTFYYYIFRCNAAIEGLQSSSMLTPAVQKQLLGEAKFLRAFFYFYLVNLFGDAPLILSTDYRKNGLMARSSIDKIYSQIVQDLLEAKQLLSPVYLDGTLTKVTTDKVRPTKMAASALLARVYLYIKEYTNAITEANETIGVTTNLPDLEKVFLKNSAEAIWQLQPVVMGRNTEDGWTFIIPPSGPSNLNGANGNPVYLSNQLLNVFEDGDKRKDVWIGQVTPNASNITYFFPSKYKNATPNTDVTEYQMVFRLSEQFLIRAEARAAINELLEAKKDINTIRKRAGLLGIGTNDQHSLLDSIRLERQLELFTELGHRWLDLKRLGKIDEVMNTVTPLKAPGTSWKTHQQLFPIPYRDIEMNPNLKQNPGY